MTEKFKQECKNYANANRIGKIEYGDNQIISCSDYLQSLTIDESCAVNNEVLSSICSRTIKLNTLQNYNLLNQEINALIGVKYDDSSEEYINVGKYIISEEKNETTTKTDQITGYDYLKLLDKKYICGITDWVDKTIRDVLLDVCQQTGLTLETTNFTNDDIPVNGNLFQGGETCNQVLKAILNVTLNFAYINRETNTLSLKWLDNEVSEIFTKDDYSILEKNNVVGPINCLVVKLTNVDGENVTRQDDESITLNGENQFIINDTYFLNTQELRNQYIDALWNKIKGFNYVDYKLTTYTGKPYLTIGNKISIENEDGTYFNSYILKNNFTYDGSFMSIFEAPSLSKQEELIKNSQETIKDFKKRTEIQVKKIEGEILLNTEQNEIIQDKINNEVYTITQVNELIQNAETGLTNTFKKIGGNNLLRNTGLYFKTNDVYDYWNGNVEKKKLEKSASGTSMLLKADSLKQSLSLANGTYSVGFKYRRLNPLGNASVKYNGREIVLDEEGEITTTEEITTNSFEIEIMCDIADSYEIWELMLNKGSESAVWSQSANEVHTDTVNISKGVTVEATENDTKATLGAEGLNVVNKITNAKVLKATDTGIETTDIKATTGTTGGLMLKKVGNQTIGVGI